MKEIILKCYTIKMLEISKRNFFSCIENKYGPLRKFAPPPSNKIWFTLSFGLEIVKFLLKTKS